jgi:ribosome-associated protein
MNGSNQYEEVPNLETLRKEVVIEPYKSSGPGGQRKNKRETAVRVRYTLPHPYTRPSGKIVEEITVIGTRERSQARNIEYALEELQRRLEELYRPVIQRIPTETSAYAKEKRKQEKIYHSEKKQLRKPISK